MDKYETFKQKINISQNSNFVLIIFSIMISGIPDHKSYKRQINIGKLKPLVTLAVKNRFDGSFKSLCRTF